MNLLLIENINQMESILKNYQPLVMATGIFIALYLTIKLIKSRRKQLQEVQANTTFQASVLSVDDMKMLAGDDVISTQLDLARAYIEMGKSNLAKSILYQINKTGNPDQQEEAKRLITTL